MQKSGMEIDERLGSGLAQLFPDWVALQAACGVAMFEVRLVGVGDVNESATGCVGYQ